MTARRKLFARLKRLLRWAGRALLAAVLLGSIAAGAFVLVARSAQPAFVPVSEPLAPDVSARIAELPGYRRAEDATYLTFVEWYLVFNPQEYARFISDRRPSQFPYFRGIGQIWSGYTQVYGITRRHYRFNGGYNLMLGVIGTSSTFEFGVKGLYEKSVGRFFEWTAGGRFTPEDRYAAQVATDYGNFIPNRPWFEFPFGRSLVHVWSENSFFGRDFLRKSERKLFLSLEYGVKAVYAGVIRGASHAVYGVADTEVYLSASNLTETALSRPGVRRVQSLGPGRWIITVPHYQGFTDLVPQLALDGVRFEEIAGNDEIMVTLIQSGAGGYPLKTGQVLFAQSLLTGDARRLAVQVPVKNLGEFLREAQSKSLRIEHLFDY